MKCTNLFKNITFANLTFPPASRRLGHRICVLKARGIIDIIPAWGAASSAARLAFPSRRYYYSCSSWRSACAGRARRARGRSAGLVGGSSHQCASHASRHHLHIPLVWIHQQVATRAVTKCKLRQKFRFFVFCLSIIASALFVLIPNSSNKFIFVSYWIVKCWYLKKKMKKKWLSNPLRAHTMWIHQSIS